MKKKISHLIWIRNVWFFCSKTLLGLLHNMRLTIMLLWQHTGFQTSPMLQVILAIFGIIILIFLNDCWSAWSHKLICWPVSLDHIEGSSVVLIEVTCFWSLPLTRYFFFHWITGSSPNVLFCLWSVNSDLNKGQSK